jgi:HAD superfamily hydrolase (TIGR01509 family)
MRFETGNVEAIVYDVDGTLVDSNYEHTIAWARAFKEAGVEVPTWRIHRHVGMGGDQLVPTVAGEDVAERLGDRIRELEEDRYRELIGEVRPFPGAEDILAGCRDAGVAVILASSAKGDELERYLEILDADQHADGWTSSRDVDATKPEPDLVEVALTKAGTRAAVMVGDSVWDIVAARRAGIRTIGLLTGGFGEAELTDAGAVDVFASLEELEHALRDGLLTTIHAA